MTVGVAVIGAGRAGMIHARNFAGRVPGGRLVAVADPVLVKAGAGCFELPGVKVLADYRAVLNDPDVRAVVVATPTAFHKEIVVAAARSGRHVLCEKPMAMDAVECAAMIDAAERGCVKLQIGFMRRYDAAFVDAWRLLDTGAIGGLVQVKSLTHGPSVPKPWMYDLGKSNGPLAEVNSHDIDTLRWFTGAEFEEVYAIAGNYRCPDARAGHPDFYDNVLLTARFDNGMQGMVGGAQGVGYGYDARCELLGEKGLITIGSLGTSTTGLYTQESGTTRIEKSWTDLFDEAYVAEDREFVNAIADDRQPRVGGRDGLEAVRVVNAGNKSIAERRPVKLSEV